ncbi:glycerol-3-phosphate 1-O-acyltransferase PlsB [Salinisphaera sp. Q1T1-3]|uniref:glycerol-3-phosphate 1-O-acyltransferase PlsB n=1 Tax=Salinisphaera sp. Q1T1-3 TaxID=2321229 RepID=UPI000E70BA47|nr:glycerol-3-phosphate 1-O-acyltransferase PlsB [Salinisphaera sp. Q1T1-3]RJS92896.1 glycerol-3-phosphate 1-O-acyltransferase PlsB [Salinisphaera sp. Q1T1-3]
MIRVLLRLLLVFMPLVRWPLRAWIRTRVTPTDLDELGLDLDKPVCYVLPVASIFDWLALEAVCAARGLPRPHLAGNRPPTVKRAVVLAVPIGRSRHRSELQRIVTRTLHDHTFDVQMVPVSVFWGRNPVQETSITRILFADSERSSRLRKVLIVLVNGRNTLVHFGRPVDYRGVVAQNATPGVLVRKLVRVLRVHFRRQRAATLGPGVSRRSQLIDTLVSDPEVIRAISEGARRENKNVAVLRTRAREYADEIAADHSNIAIGFMLRVLTWLWNRIYDGIDVRHLPRLREAAHDNREIIYLPSHRSHMDYLLLSYILYEEGLALPQIAAGVNLNFWPVGGLLRRCGAFYLRRSFKGDRLYTAVFRAYVETLVARGQPMKFYPEGGRSRTGRLLAPKTGMLQMTIASALATSQDAPVSIVPVYIGYDRVMEVKGYFDELRGTRVKKGETMGDLVRGSTKVLSRKYGRVFVSFGEPIELQTFADTHLPDWRDRMSELSLDARPKWLQTFTDDLATSVMRGINATATLNATGLASLVLLGAPQKSVAEDEMVHTLATLARVAHACPYSPDASAPEPDGTALLAEAEPTMRLIRAPHAWGDILTVDSRQAVLLTYTRNNVMHLFALPSLIANFFAHFEQRNEKALLGDAVELYPLLASELFLRWSIEDCREALVDSVNGLIECGLLSRTDKGALRRPQAGSQEFAALMSLARIMRESLERYAMTATLLSHNRESGVVERGRFERQCQLMAERMALLTGRNSPEFFDARLFRNHVETLVRVGLLRREGNKLHIDDGLRHLADHALRLLGSDIRQTIAHLTSMPRLDDAEPGETLG